MKTSETQTESSKTNHSFAQTEPTIPKMYNDSEVQTETVNETENEGDSSFFYKATHCNFQKELLRNQNPYRKSTAVETFKMNLSIITNQSRIMIPRNLIPSCHLKSCAIFWKN